MKANRKQNAVKLTASKIATHVDDPGSYVPNMESSAYIK